MLGNMLVDLAEPGGASQEGLEKDHEATPTSVPDTDDGADQEWLEEESREETTPLEYEIMTMPADYTLEVLHDKWRKKEITVPKFQREYVWSITQASRLIESFIMGLPVPPVFLYVDPTQKVLVVDGMQRLRSIFDFFDGCFGDKVGKKQKAFKLSGINKESRLYGKTFEELDSQDQLRLKNTVLRSILIRQLRPHDRTSIYHIFERLNTGGMALKDQEVRNCVYEGKLNDLLTELNTTAEWRDILGRPKPDKRKRDVQLILRYMALFHNGKDYHKPMRDFMSKFMGEKKDPPDEFIRSERRRFDDTCRLVLARLGEKPFRQARSLNPAVFDSMFVAFARNPDSCPADIVERAKNLRGNQDFQRYTTHATTDDAAVRSRLDLAQKSLFG